MQLINDVSGLGLAPVVIIRGPGARENSMNPNGLAIGGALGSVRRG
jgi:hypothetical protein